MEGRSRARSRDCDARLDPTSSIRRPCILWLRKVHCNRLRDIQAGAHQVILNDPPVLEQGAARGVRMGHWKLHVTDVCHTQAQYTVASVLKAFWTTIAFAGNTVASSSGAKTYL